jgi:hypothetical protein
LRVADVTEPIFVFGSNERGAHGKGAALFARQYRGAIAGQGVGRQGNAYAIPTKDDNLRPLPLRSIGLYVAAFLAYAHAHPHESFEVTPVGCGLAGYRPEDIAPFFRGSPENVFLPVSFRRVLDGML